MRRDTGSTGNRVPRDAGQPARETGWPAESLGGAPPEMVPHCRIRRLSVTDFYGIQAGTVPGFADAGGGKFMSVQGMPDRTVQNMVTFMDKLRGMHEQNPLAFEVCVRHVASVIEDQRRREGHTDPRDDRTC